MRKKLILSIIAFIAIFFSCQNPPLNNTKAFYDGLKPLHSKLETPQRGDWLYSHEERNISLDEYLSNKPVRAVGKRQIIYLQPIGNFSEDQFKIVEITARYLSIFFQLDVKINSSLNDTIIPDSMKRIHWEHEQFNSRYILYDVLSPRLPEDAFCVLGVTATDLYPSDEYNFVFGQASIKSRVGVASLFYYTSEKMSEEAFQKGLMRYMKTTTHETGHMFSIRHCIEYKCLMNGSNSLPEADRKPLYLCPSCLAKLSINRNYDLEKRFFELYEFYSMFGFESYSEYCRIVLNVIEEVE